MYALPLSRTITMCVRAMIARHILMSIMRERERDRDSCDSFPYVCNVEEFFC